MFPPVQDAAFGPAKTLANGDFDGGRLLIIELSCFVIAHRDILSDETGHGLSVFGQASRWPAVLKEIATHNEASAANLLCRINDGTRALAEDDDSVHVDAADGSDPVFGQVLHVPITAHDAIAILKGVIHILQEIRGADVVRIHEAIAVVGFDVDILFEVIEQEVQSETFAAML